MLRTLPVVIGTFCIAQSSLAQCTARWLTGTASPAPNGIVRAVAVYDGALIIAGGFTSVGGVSASRIARWDGTAWTTLGSGMNDQVNGLAVWNGQLVAVGAFTSAGGSPANRLATWNGTAWSPMGAGANDQVYAVTVWNGQLAICGDFFRVNDEFPFNGVATSADGIVWDFMYDGLDYGVRDGFAQALTTYNGDLIVAGTFTQAGSVPASKVARWDGSTWSALGSGLSSTGTVAGLTSYNGELYACGFFSTADAAPVSNIARWNGSAWNNVGGTGSTNGFVQTVGTFGSDLIATGSFSMISGTSSSFISRWNGSAWAGLTGGGLNGAGYALTSFNGEMVVGGDFTTAGSMSSGRLARWTPNNTVWIAAQPGDQEALCEGGNVSFSVSIPVGYTGVTYQWREGLNNLANGVTPSGSIISGATSSTLTISNAKIGDSGLYQCVVRASTCAASASNEAVLEVQGCCGTSDFNGDGDFGTDADIEAFFACLGGDCCPTCYAGGSDFNADGDFGTDADIEAFFRVLAGGSC